MRDIYIPCRKKLREFDNNYEKGIQWYERFFEGHKSEKITADITPYYMHVPKVTERIYQIS